jgi:hypothetical protein
MCVTAHFIHNWKLTYAVIGFREFMESHNGSNIRSLFEKILQDFEIQEKVFCVTTDNASNNLTFTASVLLRQFNAREHHIRCFPHVMNLCSQSFLSYVSDIIALVRKVFKKSGIAQSTFYHYKHFAKHQQ